MQPYSIKFLLFIFLFFSFAPTSAQESYRLFGRVSDALSGEGLAGASVYLQERSSIGTITDANGNYTLTAPTGSYTVQAKYLGYDAWEKAVLLNKDRELSIEIAPTAIGVQEVEVVAERQQPITESATMGELELPMETIKTLPVLFGELDILKTVQLLPGVQSGGEGNTGFYVRGGGADQNLVLLDKAIVYNPGHLFNFFSVFNSAALENTTLIKGNMPARYGGRLSSVLDIEMRDGDMSDFSAEGGIGLIASRLTVQGPIAEDKASFIFSGRRTYVDALLSPFMRDSEQGGVPFSFYDLNGKLTYSISENDKLSLSGYYGRDVGEMVLSGGQFTSDFFWGNATATAQWNHRFNDKLRMDVSGVLSRYQFQFNWDYGGYDAVVQTGVEDYSLNADFDYSPDVRHHLQYGVQYTHHTLRPRSGGGVSEEGEVVGTDRVLPKYAHEMAVYVSDDWDVTDKLLLSLGLRSSYFAQVGPFNHYFFNHNLVVVDSTRYERGDRVRSYQALEPRASVRYTLNERSSLKAGFSRSAQYLHLVSNAYTTLPLDVWVPSSAIIEPQFAKQYALGFFRSTAENQYEGSVEVYYKDLRNQLEYREGYAPGPRNRDMEYDFVSGSGKSYGVELFLRKNYGDLQGWVGYTLSKTTRQFPDLNDGKEFPATNDQRHNLSLVSSYRHNDRWTFGGTFIFSTGQATTLPLRRYYIEGSVNYQYGDRNSFRMQPTHRLDLSATLEGKERKRMSSSWTFSIYNVYGRRNPFLYYVDTEGSLASQDVKLQAKKVSIVPFPLPSVTWNFNWK